VCVVIGLVDGHGQPRPHRSRRGEHHIVPVSPSEGAAQSQREGSAGMFDDLLDPSHTVVW
jgi:hypothetical protein